MFAIRIICCTVIGLLATCEVMAAVSTPISAKSADNFRLSVEAVNSPVFPGEPVRLRLAWRNVSPQAAQMTNYRIYVLYVGVPGQAATQFELYEARPAELRSLRPVPLNPGESFHSDIWVAVGRESPRPDRQPWRWLFPAAGEYQVWPEGYDPRSAGVVQVVEPVDPSDRTVREWWNLDLATAFLGGTMTPETRVVADKIVQLHPQSRYAPYAAWAKVLDLCGGQLGVYVPSVDNPAMSKLLEFIIDRHPKSMVREDALRQAFTTYIILADWQHAKQMVQSLAKEFPQSRYLANLRRAYGEDFERVRPPPPPPTPLVAKVAKPADLKIEGIETVPDGPRQALKAFLDAMAREDLDGVKKLLAADFMGDGGPTHHGPVSGLWKDYNTSEIRVAVKKAESVDTYTRPASLPMGSEQTWKGRICLIEVSMSVRRQDLLTAKSEDVEYERIWWAFRENPAGQWRLVSQHRYSRNWLASQLGTGLRGSLESGFITWRVSDGKSERRPFEEIRNKLGLKNVVDTRTQWKASWPMMVGPKHEQVQIRGNLRLLVRDEQIVPAKEEWIEREVTLLLDLAPDDKSLLLRDIQISDTPTVSK